MIVRFGPPALAAAGGLSLTMHFETLAVHAGSSIDPKTGAVTLPIHLSTTYERAEDGSYPGGFIYTRSGNPTRQALESCLAQLEGGVEAAAFSSGSAATAAVFQALNPGDHVIAPDDAYYGTPMLLRDYFARWGLQATFVDMATSGRERRRRATRDSSGSKTPSNPLLHVTDIAAAAGTRAARGATLRRRQHVGDAGAPASAGAWRRPGHALDDEISERPQRRARRALVIAREANELRGGCAASRARRRRAVALRLLAGAAGHPLAALPHARARREREPAVAQFSLARTPPSSACTSRAWRQIPATRSPRAR